MRSNRSRLLNANVCDSIEDVWKAEAGLGLLAESKVAVLLCNLPLDKDLKVVEEDEIEIEFESRNRKLNLKLKLKRREKK